MRDQPLLTRGPRNTVSGSLGRGAAGLSQESGENRSYQGPCESDRTAPYPVAAHAGVNERLTRHTAYRRLL